MTQPAKGQEPSMEEILASIRRIIADDYPGSKPTPPEAAGPVMRQPPGSAPPTRMPCAPRSAAAEAPPPPTVELDSMPAHSMLVQARATGARRAPSTAEGPASGIPDPTGRMAAAEPPPPAFRTIGAESVLGREEGSGESPPPARTPGGPRRPAPQAEPALISAAASAAVGSAFDALARTVPVQNGRTLEDLVGEMLRPMLKGWLEDNLPSLVERLVRAEIDRVSRGRG